MSEWKQKFIGNGKLKQFGSLQVMKCMINMDVAEAFVKELKSGKNALFFDIMERKSDSEYGDTHNIVVSIPPDEQSPKEEDPDDLPF